MKSHKVSLLVIAIIALSGLTTVLMIFSILFMLGGLFFMFGQDKLPDLCIVNNTQQKITVTTDGVSVLLPPGKSCRTPFPGVSSVIVVQQPDGVIWNYRWQPLDYNKYSINHVVYMQIESDGLLYVFPFVNTSPDELPVQPKDFPLRPQRQQ